MTLRRHDLVFLAALAVILFYIFTKAMLVGQFWFNGTEQWQQLFRPFPDWGTGADLYGALLPAKWLGTRTLCHAGGFLAILIIALCCRAYILAALFACEAALIELLDILWLLSGQSVGWSTPATGSAIVASLLWIALLLGAAWVLAGQRHEAAVAAPRRESSAGHSMLRPLARLIDRYFIYFCYFVAFSYAVMKIVFAYWWYFDSISFWLAAYRPFPDWGTGADLFGAIFPARWIGSRNLAYGLFILFAIWYSARRHEHRLLGLLLLQGMIIEFFDGFWLANGKFNWGWAGNNTDFYMNGGFLWAPDLLLVGIYVYSRSQSVRSAGAAPATGVPREAG